MSRRQTAQRDNWSRRAGLFPASAPGLVAHLRSRYMLLWTAPDPDTSVSREYRQEPPGPGAASRTTTLNAPAPCSRRATAKPAAPAPITATVRTDMAVEAVAAAAAAIMPVRCVASGRVPTRLKLSRHFWADRGSEPEACACGLW